MSRTVHTGERPDRRVSHRLSRSSSRHSHASSSSGTTARATVGASSSPRDISTAAEEKLLHASPPLNYIATNDGAVYLGRHHVSRTSNHTWMQAHDGSWWHVASPADPRYGAGIVDTRSNIYAQAARDPEIRAYLDVMEADVARRRGLPREHPDFWPPEEEEDERVLEEEARRHGRAAAGGERRSAAAQFGGGGRVPSSRETTERISCGEGYIERSVRRGGGSSSSSSSSNLRGRAFGASSRASERPEMPPLAPLPRLHSRHESARPASRR
ncbi:MAG: hypothetical protein Q9173_004465 [Seirophora scorigena]